MKDKICSSLIALCFFAALGIVGGVELGASGWNLLWCLPCFVAAWVSALLAGFID